MTKRKIETLVTRGSPEIRLNTGPDGVQRLSGTAVVFGCASVDLGGFTEIVNPGAFTRTLRQNPDVLMLRDHISSQLLGRTIARTLELTQDDTGLHFVCTLPKTSIAEDTAENVRNGNLGSCSFGFSVVKDKWTTNPDKSIVRTLIDVDLAEISVTSFAAYPATTVSLRSCPPEIRSLLKRGVVRSAADDCDCDCDDCMNDDCANCSVIGCDDPQCGQDGCPSQDDQERNRPLSYSERSKLAMRLELSKRK